MTALLQVLFDALSLGSLYALGALGIALIFGVMRLVNFAHGDYIAFCVFAMLWPSIDAAAIVFAGQPADVSSSFPSSSRWGRGSRCCPKSWCSAASAMPIRQP